MATIDFETYSEANLPKVGAYVYAEDSSTRVLTLSYNMSDTLPPHPMTLSSFLHDLGYAYWVGGTFFCTIKTNRGLRRLIAKYNAKLDEMGGGSKLWIPGMKPPEELLQHIRDGGHVEAHNSFFEHCIWHFVCHRRYGWPAMPVTQWRCSMGRARAAGLPGQLGILGNALGLEIQKDPRGEFLIHRLCKPARGAKTMDMFVELLSYNGTDVDAEIAASQKVPHLPPAEQELWELDQGINWGGVYVDMPSVDKILQAIQHIKDVCTEHIIEATAGYVTSANQIAKIIEWCKGNGVPLAGLTKADVTKALKKDIPENVRAVLEARQILGKMSTAKYVTMKTRVAQDGRLHEILVYHKASTGRFGGAGVQLHNLPRPVLDVDPEVLVGDVLSGNVDLLIEKYGNPLQAIADAIRPMIIAAPGYILMCGDYNAIEARVLLWTAGDQDGLGIFRRGECIYSDMAAQIFNTTYKHVYEGYKADDLEATNMRKLGKDAVLGLGYQMGGPKFAMMCNGRITEEFAKDVVDAYRTKFRKVKQLWSDIEKAAMEAVRTGRAVHCGRVSYKVQGIFLLCRLPSGRCIHYAYPTIEKSITSWGAEKDTLFYKTYERGGFYETPMYGGLLVENIVQAIARDLIRDAMVRLDKAGYRVLFSVHDEAAVEVEEGTEDLDKFIEIMCELPDWAHGLPIKAAGWVGKRYRK